MYYYLQYYKIFIKDNFLFFLIYYKVIKIMYYFIINL
jgi:hypothetical protein